MPLPGFELALEPQEVGLQVRRRLVAELAVLLESLFEDLPELARHRRVRFRQRLRRTVQDRLEDDGVGVALERHLPGRHLVEHRAEREEVGPRVRELPPGLLRRHVVHGPHHRPGSRERPGSDGGDELRDFLSRFGSGRRGFDLREAEIEDLHLSAVVDHDVGGLQVPVRDPLRVGGLERVGDLDPVVEEQAHVERLPAHPLGEGGALDELHHDERPSLVLLDRIDGADAGVVQRRGRPRLALEALEHREVVLEARGKHLDRDAPAEVGVLGFVHHAHAAGAEQTNDLVVSDGLSDQRFHESPPASRISGG